MNQEKQIEQTALDVLSQEMIELMNIDKNEARLYVHHARKLYPNWFFIISSALIACRNWYNPTQGKIEVKTSLDKFRQVCVQIKEGASLPSLWGLSCGSFDPNALPQEEESREPTEKEKLIDQIKRLQNELSELIDPKREEEIRTELSGLDVKIRALEI